MVAAFETFETERLMLRPFQESDAPVQRQLWTERDVRVPAHRKIDADGHPTVDDITQWIRGERRRSGPRLLALVRKDTGDVIGYCGFVFHGNGAADEPEIAFELVQAVHGRGYATEAARAVVAWADAAGYRRLWATVRDWNAASRRVLARLGFDETGEIEPDEVHGDSLLTVREH